MWPRKYGWLNFAILECSLNVWIVNKTVFAGPELREKYVAKSEVFSSLPKMTSRKPFFGGNFKHQYLPRYSIFLVKSCKRNQWNLPNILAYISGIFDGFFKTGLVPLTIFAVCVHVHVSRKKCKQQLNTISRRLLDWITLLVAVVDSSTPASWDRAVQFLQIKRRPIAHYRSTKKKLERITIGRQGENPILCFLKNLTFEYTYLFIVHPLVFPKIAKKRMCPMHECVLFAPTASWIRPCISWRLKILKKSAHKYFGMSREVTAAQSPSFRILRYPHKKKLGGGGREKICSCHL